MKKIIEGKRYNTETATEIYDWSRGIPGDFNYRRKTLYHTKKGAWFIHHVGGPNTDMAVAVWDNSFSGSEDIEPIGEDEAFEFLQKYDGIEALEKHFGDQVTDA
ncbi:hypothetical protein [Lentibacillus salinarum]|uniref:Phage protein n=1 Tax=Lentibacillus salinarum TaxID=446820 RepID=A0ABW3ZYC2_9BACI